MVSDADRANWSPSGLNWMVLTLLDAPYAVIVTGPLSAFFGTTNECGPTVIVPPLSSMVALAHEAGILLHERSPVLLRSPLMSRRSAPAAGAVATALVGATGDASRQLATA